MKELSVIKQDAIITVNFEEVRESLIKTMEQYKGIVVTAEELKICKETQKELSKIKSNIDNYRKTIKKEMEQPIKAFEKQCKELISLVDEAESPIKEGIKVFDNLKLEEKKEKVREILKAEMILQGVEFNITVEDLKINLSNSIADIRKEIDSKIDGEKLRIANEELEKVKYNQEIEKKARELVEQQEEEIQPQGKAFEVVLKVNDDISKIKALKEYMELIGLKYEVVEQRRV